MTIAEAIEATNEAAVFLKIHHQGRLAQGVELGIKALEELKRSRILPPNGICSLLTGETAE